MYIDIAVEHSKAIGHRLLKGGKRISLHLHLHPFGNFKFKLIVLFLVGMFIQLNPIEDFSVIGGNVADSGLINGDFDGFAKSKVANVVSLGGVPRFKPFLLLLLVEPTQALAHKHHIFAITIGTVFLLSLEPPNPQLQRITVRQSGMLASVGLSVAGAGPD